MITVMKLRSLGVAAVGLALIFLLYWITRGGHVTPLTWILCAGVVFSYYLGFIRKRPPASTLFKVTGSLLFVCVYLLLKLATFDGAMLLASLLTSAIVLMALINEWRNRRGKAQ